MADTNASKAQSATSQSFLTAFVTNTAVLVIEVGAFLYLKQHVKRVYSPRTYLPPPDKRAKELPPGPWRWILSLATTPTEDIIHKNGLDAYLYVRYMRMLVWIFTFYTISTFAILLPVDSAGISTSKAKGLDQFNWDNIPKDQTKRYAAHLVLVYILTFFTLWLIRRESLKYVHLRQQFLVSPSHSRQAAARTVLITSVPDELTNDEKALRKWASFVPGGIGRIWIYRESKQLTKEYDRRVKACNQLESAASKLLRKATKTWRSQQQKAEKLHHKELQAAGKRPHKKSAEPDVEKANGTELLEQAQEASDEFHFDKPPPTKEGLLSLVPETKWPTHRVRKFPIPFTGKKVNTITWCKEEIAKLNADMPALRHQLGQGKPVGSVFIECNLQFGAHILAQVVSYHEPLMMTDKWVDVHCKDVIWNNLDDGAYEVRSRYVISWVLTLGLIILWAFPVAFIGLVSNLSQLCQQVSWLAWVCKAPTPAPGIIEGLLPPVLLAVLFILLPIILRAFAIYECVPRYTLVDLSLYKRFYIFLVIHGFLVMTLSSGLTAAIPKIISDPGSVVEDLAENLPRSAVFFLTYMVTQGFAGAGGALLQIAPLILHYVKKRFFGQTPRQAFQVTFMMPYANFGLILPRMSLLATIGIAYSVISPLINALAAVVYALYFMAWKFLFLYVFDQPDEMETGGFYFPLAISNLFTGLYIEQGCLAVLFFLVSASGHNLAFISMGVLMIILILMTVAVHVLINNAVKPVTHYLPASLANKKLQERYWNNRKKHAKIVPGKEKKEEEGAESEEEDMFSRNRVQSIIHRKMKKLETKIVEEEHKLESPKPTADGNGSNEASVVKASGLATTSTTASSGPPQLPPVTALEHLAASQQTAVHAPSEPGQPAKDEGEKLQTGKFDAPAARLKDDDDTEDGEEELEEHAFDPPSTYAEARWIWLPHDELGFSDVLLKDLKEGTSEGGGIDASDVGASMDAKGTVECSRNPPDEDWSGGFDQ